MPERIKKRTQLSELLMGPQAYQNRVCLSMPDSAVMAGLEVADQLYVTVAYMDLQRALTVARATHETGCCAPEKLRHQWKRDDCCGYCLRAAILDAQPFNMGQEAGAEDQMDTPEELRAARAEHERLEAGGWTPQRTYTGERLGLATELCLYKTAQTCGAAILLGGPNHTQMQVRFARGSRPNRQELVLGLQRAIQQAQQEVDRMLREGDDGWEGASLLDPHQ